MFPQKDVSFFRSIFSPWPAARLNEELDLPEKYVAVQIRRGDKVAGNRKVRRRRVDGAVMGGILFQRLNFAELESNCSRVE